MFASNPPYLRDILNITLYSAGTPTSTGTPMMSFPSGLSKSYICRSASVVSSDGRCSKTSKQNTRLSIPSAMFQIFWKNSTLVYIT